MGRIDFSSITNWDACPVWWRSFVNVALGGIIRQRSAADDVAVDDALQAGILKYNGRIIDSDMPGEIQYLEFDTEDDLNAFKLVWTLYGE